MNYICRLLILSYEDFGVTMSFGELTLLLINCQSLSFHISVAKSTIFCTNNRQLSKEQNLSKVFLFWSYQNSYSKFFWNHKSILISWQPWFAYPVKDSSMLFEVLFSEWDCKRTQAFLVIFWALATIEFPEVFDSSWFKGFKVT